MASRTQLRLGQVTGSFGDAEGKIVDNLAVAATLATIVQPDILELATSAQPFSIEIPQSSGKFKYVQHGGGEPTSVRWHAAITYDAVPLSLKPPEFLPADARRPAQRKH